MQKLQITMSEPTYIEIKKISKEKDISVSEVIRRGMEDYLKRLKEEKIKEKELSFI